MAAGGGSAAVIAAGSKQQKTELLNLLGEVKARVQDKLGISFPIPQFILIGRQSVGKSRLIEALAGECFNFVSGSLGSRRPTVLEFRNVASHKSSHWFVRDRTSMKWLELPVDKVMLEVGRLHEELGETVSHDPVHVRIESPACVDMQIVDLPGFRDFAVDEGKKGLQQSIESLVEQFMNDKNNVILCVEQAGDSSTMSTLERCKKVDPKFERTVLIRSKLDKYYADLTAENVNNWIKGFEDLPQDLSRPVRFALTLPNWREGDSCPKPFLQLREEKSLEDLRVLKSKNLSESYVKYIGFNNFRHFMERKTEQMFSEALSPVLTSLVNLKGKSEKDGRAVYVEYNETDPLKILSTTRDCGISFATALTHVMDGILDLKPFTTLEEELRAFHKHHQVQGSTHFISLPDVFSNLDDYMNYLRNDIQISTFDVEVNGGAQFRRLMYEVEVFLRFSDISVDVKKRDIIQARGVSMNSLTWREVVVKLLSNEAHLPLQRRLAYVGERIKWFFEMQKEVVLAFMDSLEGTPSANLYSPLYSKHAKLIKSNDVIKQLVFQTYDAACARQLKHFVELFDNMLTSTFSNPWVFLKGAAAEGSVAEDSENACRSFDDIKERIPKELQSRSGIDATLSKWLQNIPTESHEIDKAVEKVHMLVLRTYSFIRSQVCDQVELFAESFFKLPMLRRLEEDMSMIDLNEGDKKQYGDRREMLGVEIKKSRLAVAEISDCIQKLESFKFKRESSTKRT